MLIPPLTTNEPTFGYHNILKKLYIKGRLPVKYGFYGDKLTKKNVTLEHLQCRCQGGKTELSNLVLASAKRNNDRGDKPLKDFIDWGCVGRYLEQFHDINIRDFNGNQYIEMVLNTIMKLVRE